MEASPNPFFSDLNISFNLPKEGITTLEVFDLKGQRVTLLQAGFLFAGQHQVHWNAQDASGQSLDSGMYILRLKTADEIVTKRVVLTK